MITRVLFAAILAGIAAGLAMSLIQHTKVVPYIVQAEAFENVEAATTGHGTNEEKAHSHGEGGEWAPHDGFERTAFTFLGNVITGVAFAFVLAGAAMLTGLPLTAANGVTWGLMGFLAFTLAPSAGLPPELPGMMAADLFERQVWWWATVAATGIGIVLLYKMPSLVMKVLAVGLIALPHLIGAPHIPAADATTDVPASLANAYASAAIATSAVLWILIGVFLGHLLSRTLTTEEATA
jgi:cobalt transporter subunit CbtA